MIHGKPSLADCVKGSEKLLPEKPSKAVSKMKGILIMRRYVRLQGWGFKVPYPCRVR